MFTHYLILSLFLNFLHFAARGSHFYHQVSSVQTEHEYNTRVKS